MKNLNDYTAKKSTFGNSTETAENKEITNRQRQFDRLLEATSEARKIKTKSINEATSEAAAYYFATRPINFYLLNHVYKQEGITEFKKFNEWKNESATVIKGSKAYPIWGQPVGAQKEEEAEAKGEAYEATEEENRRFPMCYVFSNLQVRPITAERGAYVSA